MVWGLSDYGRCAFGSGALLARAPLLPPCVFTRRLYRDGGRCTPARRCDSAAAGMAQPGEVEARVAEVAVAVLPEDAEAAVRQARHHRVHRVARIDHAAGVPVAAVVAGHAHSERAALGRVGGVAEQQ